MLFKTTIVEWVRNQEMNEQNIENNLDEMYIKLRYISTLAVFDIPILLWI